MMLMKMKKNIKIMRMKGSYQQHDITTMRKRKRMTRMMMMKRMMPMLAYKDKRIAEGKKLWVIWNG